MTIVRASSGIDVEVEPRQAPRRNHVADDPLDDLDRQFAGRDRGEQSQPDQHRAACAVRSGKQERGGDEPDGSEGNGSQVDRRRVAEAQAPNPEAQARHPADAALELTASAADQVEADVSAAFAGRALRNLPRALDGLERHAKLRLAGGFGQFLHRVPVAIPAAEIHAAVDTDRIPLEDLFDQADALEELRPVERGNQVQAAEQARHEGLCGRLVASFGANGVLERHAAGGEPLVQFASQHAGIRLVLARMVQQAHDERGMEHVRPGAQVGARAG